MNDMITANMALWWAIGAAMTGGCFGFFIACLMAAGMIRNTAEESYESGYAAATDDQSDDGMVSCIRWECTARGAARTDAANLNPTGNAPS